MADNKSVFEFLSKCWVPFISGKNRIYYACGNTQMRDFLEDFKVSSEMDILVLGVGDVRHVMKTVAGLSRRPPSTGQVQELHFHLNDIDQEIIARDIILLEIMNKVNPENETDMAFLWSVWYNISLLEKDFKRLLLLLEDLIEKYSNASRTSEKICSFGDQVTKKSVLKIWNEWRKQRLNCAQVKENRLRIRRNPMTHCDIPKYGAMQVYVDRGIRESDVEIVGKEMLIAGKNGFVRFSEDKNQEKDFINPTLTRPGCKEWCLEDGAHAPASYLPLEKDFVDKFSTLYEACYAKMKEIMTSYALSWKMTKITYTVWTSDMFHLCHWQLPSYVKFDFIFTSNLIDHVGLLNLLITTESRLKNFQSILLTESFNWGNTYPSLKDFLCGQLLVDDLQGLPSLLGLQLAEDLDIGSADLNGFYRTMHGRDSDSEPIIWTKRFTKENSPISPEENRGIQSCLFSLVAQTFRGNVKRHDESSIQQTPLTTMYCFQRLQHLIKDGMSELLAFVEDCMRMGEKSLQLDFSNNRLSWDVICWAFGLKHNGDRLCLVKFKVDDAVFRQNQSKPVSCRLRVESSSLTETAQIISLYQFDAWNDTFQFPILESTWNNLDNNSTISLVGLKDESGLVKLNASKFRLKEVGKVIEKYDQPKHINSSAPVDFNEEIQRQTLRKSSSEETLLPFRLIDDSELIAFTSGHEIKKYLEETMLCDLMFSSPADIKAREKTMGKDILTDNDPFLILRIVVERIWHIASDKNELFRHTVRLLAKAEATKYVLILEIEGYYRYRGLPFVKLRFSDLKKEVSENVAPESEPQQKVTTIEAKELGSFNLLRRLLQVNSVKVAQNEEKPETSEGVDVPWVNSFLQMMFYRGNGEEMTAALYEYPSNPDSVKKYIRRIYAPSIRQNHVSRIKKILEDDKDIMEVTRNMLQGKDSPPELKMKLMERFSELGSTRPDLMQKMMREAMADATQSDFTERLLRNIPQSKAESKDSELSDSCFQCKKILPNLKRCSKCRKVSYCSKGCQEMNWPTHKGICSSSKSDTPITGSLRSKAADERAMCQRLQHGKDSSSEKSETYSRKPNAANEVSSKLECFQGGKEFGSPSSKHDNKRSAVQSLSIEIRSPKQSKDGCSTAVSLHEAGNSVMKTKDGSHPDEKQPETFAIDRTSKGTEAEEAGSVVFELPIDVCVGCGLKKASMKKCTKCKVAMYCSRQCQRADWSKHKSTCSNATCELEAPVERPPLAQCNNCGIEAMDMKKCSRCKNVYYCGTDCQRQDWTNHRVVCRP